MSPHRLTLWTALLLASAPAAARGAGDAVFADTQVFAIDIALPQPAFWDSLLAYYAAGDEQYLAATVTIDGVPYDSVGVRLKGNASFSHPNDKKPFRLSFDEYRDEQRWDGLKGVHLNNCWEDPTFLREKLHLNLCRDAGIAAPRANFAAVSLNGVPWGFYSLVEHVDKTFLAARFGDDGGTLYKANDGFLGTLVSDFRWYGSDAGPYQSRYELKTEEATDPWTDLVAAIDSLHNAPDLAAALPAVVDLPGLYRAFAADLMLSSLDCYAGSGRNFYCYFHPLTGKLEWIVWDAGMSFGSYWTLTQAYETLSITYASSAANRPLASRIFADPTLRDGYLHAFCDLFTHYFSAARLAPQVTALADVIRPHVQADTRKMYTDEQFETNLTADLTVGGHRKPGLTAFIAAREADVAAQLAALGIACEDELVAGEVVINEFAANNTTILDPAGEAEDWIELRNLTGADVDLGGAYLSDDPAAPALWQVPDGTFVPAGGYLIVWADEDLGQQGLHAGFKLAAAGEAIVLSNAALQTVDAVTFGPQTLNLTMARVPDGTGDFVQGPPTFGAANQFHNVIAAGAVVINEFMADNDLIPDPSGETDDWLELYNTTAAAVDLGGLYLSDSAASPTKWQFPAGTSLAAGGFLVVWADEDLLQPGLHAAFKLSASGESLLLSNTDLSVVDAVTFDAQPVNVASARYPDGVGAFVATTTPTPGAPNSVTTGVTAGAAAPLAVVDAFPNPLHGSATLLLSVPHREHVDLRVYDVKGRLVATLADRELEPGTHRFGFDARGLASGVYLYRLRTAGGDAAGRILVVK